MTLESDFAGTMSCRVDHGDERRMKLFRCVSRPAEVARQGCLHGGIPKPLLGELDGVITATLADDQVVREIRELRFERGFRCEPASSVPADDDGLAPGKTSG